MDSSNERTRNLATNKCGRRYSITLISQALNHFRDSNPKINRWYNRVTEYKPKGKARTCTEPHRRRLGCRSMAICRKVFTEIFQMLKKGEYHYYRDAENHRKKLDAYYKFLKKNGVEGWSVEKAA